MLLIEPNLHLGVLCVDHISVFFAFFTCPTRYQRLHEVPISPSVLTTSQLEFPIFIGCKYTLCLVASSSLLGSSRQWYSLYPLWVNPDLFMLLIEPNLHLGVLCVDHISVFFAFFTCPTRYQRLHEVPISPSVLTTSQLEFPIFIGCKYTLCLVASSSLLGNSRLPPQLILDNKILTLCVDEIKGLTPFPS